MKQVVRHACLALAALFGVATAGAQNFDQVEIRSERLAEGLHVLFGAGGNIALAHGADATFIVDDQYAPLAPKIRAAIAKHTEQPVRFVLNTHWHGDHTGGNESFGQTGAVIFAHDNVRKRMAAGQLISLLGSQVPPAPQAALPVVTFAGELTLHLNGEEIRAVHAPQAHTDGDAIVHFTRADVIHLGDLYFNGFYPFIDTSSGGSPDGVIAAIDRALVLAKAETRIIPGHGPMASPNELRNYRTMLADVAGRVKALVAAGKSLTETLAAKPSAAYDEQWGKGFIKPERFVTMLYGAYSQAQR